MEYPERDAKKEGIPMDVIATSDDKARHLIADFTIIVLCVTLNETIRVLY